MRTRHRGPHLYYAVLQEGTRSYFVAAVHVIFMQLCVRQMYNQIGSV